MSNTFNVGLDGKTAKPMTHEQITALFSDKYPVWAASAIASQLTHDLINGIHDADKDYLEINTVESNYQVIDMDTAAEQSGIGSFNADDYGYDEDEDEGYEEDYIESWIEDVEANLTGVIDVKREGMHSEFLVRIS